jgi:glycine hydroxymethyltransferase
MIRFTCDYSEGAHPEILHRLAETNSEQLAGYEDDPYCESAKEKIRQAVQCPNASVFFLVGGTQTNVAVIDALLPHYAGVICASTGHIAVHEAGGVELHGHKVITLPEHLGKLTAVDLNDYLTRFYNDPTWAHMAIPGMVYISYPTEWGTIYAKEELASLYAVCKRYSLPLFIDGARLGYGLCAPTADLTLKDLAQLCDVFTIGGTKVGALCGEVVVFPLGNAPQHFFSIIKQHGALLAKGRLLGIQFDTLFSNNLYFRISQHAIDCAIRLRSVFEAKGIPFYIESPTNQQFPILTTKQIAHLEKEVAFEIWEELAEHKYVTRFATSWATPNEHIELLARMLL